MSTRLDFPFAARALLALLLGGLCLNCPLPGSAARADEETEAAARSAAARAAAKEAEKHLRYSRTYAEALWEARLRNVPVFLSRHKDF